MKHAPLGPSTLLASGEIMQSLNRSPLAVGHQISSGPSILQSIPSERIVPCATSRIFFHSDPTSPAADRIRYLRMRLREPWEARKLKTLLITSPLAHDGKSTIALNLATALAEGGKRSVALVDADLHRSPLLDQLGLPARSEGLAYCLETGSDPLSAIVGLEPLSCYLLPSGKAHTHRTELLQPKALSDVMQQLSAHFDWILVDSPPVLPISDALALRQHAEASLLVVRAGSTPKDSVDEAVALLGPEHVFGIVLNGIDGLGSRYYEYGYYTDDVPGD